MADPDSADDQAERRHQRRGVWLSSTWEGMVALNGLLDPEAGQTLLAALEPLARPAGATDERSGSQRRADALVELARRSLESGRLPQTGGVRPQLTVTVDLDSLLSPRARWAGRSVGWGRWTRRRAGGWPVTGRSPGCWSPATPATTTRAATTTWRPGCGPRRRCFPRPLGVPRPSRWRSGRASRVVSAAQRAALAIRDGGCALAGCDRPLAWCEAHHLRHWLHGGPTDLANLALVCRAHHRAVHEGGWRLARDPDGRLTASPPYRRPQRRPAAA